MGFDEKLSNVSRRFAGRATHLAGRLTGNTHWEMSGYAIWASAVEEEIREKGKDAHKAVAAIERYEDELRARTPAVGGLTPPAATPVAQSTTPADA
ncbi:hypothetical protein [Catellatospora tritici]|uniref:hypothetical protein n=1 Tax=Catellatospora tritici TaxID=2851566 RepID=UPI001C2CE22D|nr:hypothetical protein [Catellatospora tritici]MBV1853166.1 hypothetical protein [Catellatospora tritici]